MSKPLPDILKLARMSYLVIALIIVCFFLAYVFPEVFLTSTGNIILLLFVAGTFSCGKMYGLLVAFIVGVFVLYLRKNVTLYEGMENEMAQLAGNRTNPQQNQFLSIDRSGNVIATKIEEGGNLGSVPPPVPRSDTISQKFTWTPETMSELKRDIMKKNPGYTPEKVTKWISMFKERYDSSASNEDVRSWLSSSPHQWPWTYATDVAFTEAVKKIGADISRTPDEAEIEKLLESTKNMLPESDAKVLIPNAFLFAKWVKYFIQIRQI